MKRIGTSLSIVAVLTLGGCASPITSDCASNSICPIVIYEKLPGYFAAGSKPWFGPSRTRRSTSSSPAPIRSGATASS